MLFILFSLLPLAVLAGTSSVSVSYALEDQLPLIARINSHFSWSFSPDTFVSDADNVTFNYSTSPLPSWLSFDPSTRTLSGTPSETDEGSPQVTITAADSSTGESASSSITLCVTPYPPPQLHIPAEEQFIPDNPSLSSVFLISNTSALFNSRPALRVPPKWSYSIGFQYDTFLAPNKIYYAARMADGRQLPDWIKFNANELTFGGVTPLADSLTLPHTVQVALHASDQLGYSAGSIPFDIVVSAHDFALETSANSLPTINVTTDQPFKLTLNSAVDFSGVTVDGQPVTPANITSLQIDTSGLEAWLHFDDQNKTLTGDPPDEFTDGILPVVLTSDVNQTLHTTVMLAAVPSFFSAGELDPILVTPGDSVSFNLGWFFSNTSGLGRGSDIELSAAYDPIEAGYFLSFDSTSDKLFGTVPVNVSFDHVAVTFTAYSHITHSTSHTSLPLSLSASDFENDHNKNGGGGLSVAARAKVLLGLKIAFGIIAGVVNLAIIFAVIRRCTRVPDTALVGEEGRRGWTAEELKWYGIGIEVNGEKYEPPSVDSEKGYGTSEAALAGSGLGLGPSLSRIITRTFSNSRGSPLSPVGLPQSPPVVKKVEFLGKIRQTARIVSDKYRRVVSGPRRPMISKPTLILTGENATRLPPIRTGIEGLPYTNAEGLLPMVVPRSQHDLRPFEETTLIRYAPSDLTTPIDSPSSSTDGRSIPRRRADFAPPKAITSPPQAHLGDQEHRSVASVASSLDTNSSARTHEAEAVIQHATRAMSVRSATSVFSGPCEDVRPGEAARPRLVPFTSATRVPVPKMPSSFFSPDPDHSTQQTPGQHKTKRVASQMAKVFRNAAADPETASTAANIPQATAEDDLQTSAQYVQALGDQGGGPPTTAQGECSAAVSSVDIEAPHTGKQKATRPPAVPRMLARTGERFKFRVPVALRSAVAQMKSKGDLEARLVSGKPLPRFIKIDTDAVPSGAGAHQQKRVVELSGVPVSPNIGVYEIGLYEQEGGKCVGKVVVEVVAKKPA
ncbi:hypothetical protein BD309DRAFT_1082270 [Dichomitus squalens]|uniref:Uncharacterized protein n=1 Tax=Dichomitus squalens TaxID=114155 RepID=A0A4Q9Q3A8_9APHY|nr:hypothetical protein BD309DRAFT_1082270 [Dichomitus squalens]TBU61550.1 hypothetical protein BD310DRAFT_873614 [Dichomitus squalens]